MDTACDYHATSPAIKSLDEILSEIILCVGIPGSIKGYTFLKVAVKETLKTPQMIRSITKQLYPTIAEIFKTSSSKVERAIRHAIDVGYQKGKIQNINSYFDVKIYDPLEKPSNGEFIALIVDKLQILGYAG